MQFADEKHEKSFSTLRLCVSDPDTRLQAQKILGMCRQLGADCVLPTHQLDLGGQRVSRLSPSKKGGAIHGDFGLDFTNPCVVLL